MLSDAKLSRTRDQAQVSLPRLHFTSNIQSGNKHIEIAFAFFEVRQLAADEAAH